MSPAGWKSTLLQAAASRNISLSALEIEDIQAADDNHPLARWVMQNLVPDRLLSAEELAIWQSIEKKQFPRGVFGVGKKSTTSIPIDESSIEDAITALELSTQRIEAHIRTLQQQQASLDSYIKRHGRTNRQQSTLRQSLHRKREAELQQLKFTNSDVESQLNSQLSMMQSMIDKEMRSIPAIVNERLNFDDRALEQLITPPHGETSGSESDLSVKQKEIETLLKALKQTMASTLRSRLDRTYLEELHEHSQNQYLNRKNEADGTDQAEIEAQIQQIKDEVQTLYTEIDDVASMVVQHEHGDSLLISLNQLQHEQQDRNVQEKLETHNKLVELTTSINSLTARCQNLNSQRMVIHNIRQTLTSSKQQQRPNQVPEANRSTEKPQRQIQTETETPALTALLRSLGIDSTDTLQVGKSQHDTHPNLSIIQVQTQQLQTLLNETLKETLTTAQATAIASTSSSSIIPFTKDPPPSSISSEDNTGFQAGPFAEQIHQLALLDDRVSRSKEMVEKWTNSRQDTSRNEQRLKAETARYEFVRGWERRRDG